MTLTTQKGLALLALDEAAETERLVGIIRTQVRSTLHRKGVVLGLSGGIDSSVVAALCVRALGPDRVFGLLMPEADSSDDSLRLGQVVAEWLGMKFQVEDVAETLRGCGCYERRDEAIRTIFPDYESSWRCKLVLSDKAGAFSLSSLVVKTADGETRSARLTANAYSQIVAATNFKQRTRKMLEYYHADRLQYAVAGTPNILEHDQGFFVKNGDGAADLKPIAHLYKTQVYALAKHLGVPEEIQKRPSTTDTFSLPQSQEEFYFSVDLQTMDLCLYGKNHGIEAEELARVTGLDPQKITQVYTSIQRKRRATEYLHMRPLSAQPEDERGLTQSAPRTAI